MKELEHLGWHHLLGRGWGPLQSFDLNGTARMLLHSSGHSPSAGAAVLPTGNLGVRPCPSSHAQHEERREMSLQAKALCFGRSGVWDPQHGDSLSPLLLESRDPRWILLTSCLHRVYVRLTDKAVVMVVHIREPSCSVFWGLDFISLSTDYTWERNVGKKMNQQILGSDIAKLGTGSEEEMAVVKASPGNQHSGISNAFLLQLIDLVCLHCWLKRR